jgi:hypothetical protein
MAIEILHVVNRFAPPIVPSMRSRSQTPFKSLENVEKPVGLGRQTGVSA